MNIELTQFQRTFLDRISGLGIRFLIVGGKAMHHHGCRRSSFDLDVWVSTSGGDPERVYDLVSEYSVHLKERYTSAIFRAPDKLVRLPHSSDSEVDILTSLGSLDFESALRNSDRIVYGQSVLRILSIEDLIVSKEESAKDNKDEEVRARDLGDLKWLRKTSEGAR